MFFRNVFHVFLNIGYKHVFKMFFFNSHIDVLYNYEPG